MNIFIGEPNEALKSYTKSENRRTISDMNPEECKLILNIASDNGDWKQLSVCDVEIKSAFGNFVEGIAYFGNKKMNHFNLPSDMMEL